MTALLGMGREGMISVWSSIWSVPSAGCKEMLHYMPVCCLWQAHMHAQIHLSLNSSLACVFGFWFLFPLNKDNRHLVKFSVLWHNIKTNTFWWAGCCSHWWCDCVWGAFIAGCAVFQRKVGQAASNLDNSEVTLWPLQDMLYCTCDWSWVLVFKRDWEWIGNLREEIDPLDGLLVLDKWNTSPPFNSAPPQWAQPPSLSSSWAAAFTSEGGILFYKWAWCFSVC